MVRVWARIHLALTALVEQLAQRATLRPHVSASPAWASAFELEGIKAKGRARESCPELTTTHTAQLLRVRAGTVMTLSENRARRS